MARALKNAKLNIVCDDAGAPQSAEVEYEVWDGEASKSAVHNVADPDWTKKLHDAGVAGEFWFDEIAAIKAAESI